MVTITMLGVHKSGKTTYMGMMFNRFMDGGVVIEINGHKSVIRIEPTTPAERTNIAQWRYNNDTDALFEGKFPGATIYDRDNGSNVCSFNFYLKANGKTLSEFKFTDYPGEALEDILLSGEGTRYDNLAKTIFNSDAVIVFVDAVKLFKYEGVEDARMAVKCSYLNDAIARAAHDGYGSGGKKLHVIFALTKCDTFKQGEDSGLETKLKQVFSGIFPVYETSIYKVMSIGRDAIEPNVYFERDPDEGRIILQDNSKILRGEGHPFAPENIVSILIDALAKCNETQKKYLINLKQQKVGSQTTYENELKNMGGMERFFLRGRYRQLQQSLFRCEEEINNIERQISACDLYSNEIAEIIRQKL